MKSILFIACLIFTHFTGSSQNIQSFNELLESINQVTTEQKNTLVESFIQNAGQTPIIENDNIIFIAKGNCDHGPELLADFNGFLNQRYISDRSLGQMTQIEGTSWYYFEQTLSSDALINYQFSWEDQRQVDPLNPNVRMAFGSLYSFVRMSEFNISEEVVWDATLPAGQLIRDSIYSESLGHFRTIHVYLPPAYDEKTKPYPTIYFHDGSFFINEARAPQMLDNLIGNNNIEPVIAIFDNPVQRGKEYRGDVGYRNYLSDELIPFITKNYSTKNNKKDRAVIGFSRAGQSALYVSHNLDVFSKCGAFSPALVPTTVSEFTKVLDKSKFRPNHIFMTGARYDFIWHPDAQALKSYFEKKDIYFQYHEISEGHNIATWRKSLDDMLINFFPDRE